MTLGEPPISSAAPTGADAPARLVVEHLGVRFGGVVALDDVSLEFAAGEVCGVIGPNGAGKTTLFDVVAGAQRPNAGRVVLDGVDVVSWSAIRRARRGVRRTFQHPQLFGWLTARENVQATLDWRRLPASAAAASVDVALERCGIAGIADAPVAELPAGQARTVELARAIVDPPKVLLLDELTAGLDPIEAGRLADVIAATASEQHCAVLFIEHDIDFVMRRASRVVMLDQGRVLADGPPESVQSSALVRTAYLGGVPEPSEPGADPPGPDSE